MRNYILVGHEVLPIDDLLEWARWFETADRRVALDYVTPEVRVSTVFLGLDYRFGSGPPLLFETMIFGGPLDQETRRYATWNEAAQGHKELLQLAKLENSLVNKRQSMTGETE